MKRDYAKLLADAEYNLENDPMPESLSEAVLWLRAMADHVQEDISQDQCQSYYRAIADMIEEVL